MLILLMRHGDAIEPSHGGHDADRWLTPEGRARVVGVARSLVTSLARTNVDLVRVFASPKVRAVQTAELVVGCFDRPIDVSISPALAAGSPAEALAPVNDGFSEMSSSAVLFVGHMPLIAAMSSHLDDPSGDFGPHFTPSMVRAHERSEGAANAKPVWTIDPLRP